MAQQPFSSDSSQFFLCDIGVTFVHEKDLIPYLKTKSGCILTNTIEDFINRFGGYSPIYAEERVRKVVKWDLKEIESREMRLIPSTLNEFRNNKYYTVAS